MNNSENTFMNLEWQSNTVATYKSPQTNPKSILGVWSERLSKPNMRSLYTFNSDADFDICIDSNGVSRVLNHQNSQEVYYSSNGYSTNMSCFSYVNEEDHVFGVKNLPTMKKNINTMSSRTLQIQTKSSHDDTSKRLIHNPIYQ